MTFSEKQEVDDVMMGLSLANEVIKLLLFSCCMSNAITKGRTIRNNQSGGGGGGEKLSVQEFYFLSPLVCRIFFFPTHFFFCN